MISQLLLSTTRQDVRYQYIGSYAGTGVAGVSIGTAPPSGKRVVVAVASAVRGGGLTNTITGMYIDIGGGAVAMNMIYSNGTGNVSGASAQVAMAWYEVSGAATTASISFSLAAGSSVVQTAIEVSIVYDYDSATPTLSVEGAQVVNANATLQQTMNEKTGGMTIIASNGASDGPYTPTDVTSHYSTKAYGVWSINRKAPNQQAQAYTLANARFFMGAHWR